MPIYETLQDRHRQFSIAAEYAAPRGLTITMTDATAMLPWDVEFLRDGVTVSIAEIKARSCARLAYSTYKVDRAKIDAMVAEATRREVRCGMLVQFADGRYKLPITSKWLAKHARVSVLHRKDREGETPDPAWEWSNIWWQTFDE